MCARRLAGALILLSLAGSARAVEPDEMLANPRLEARARTLSAGLRCLVCQNQSVDDSDAALAHDLRVLVRERLSAGDTDGEVRDFLVARYGPYILLRPPLSPVTLLLWATPILCLGAGGIAAFVAMRRRAMASPPAPLDADERAALERLTRAGSARPDRVEPRDRSGRSANV